MNPKHILLAVALAGGLLSTASAAVVASPLRSDEPAFTTPAPIKVVTPTGIQRRYRSETIRVGLTVDEQGRAHGVRLLARRDSHLEKRLLPAIAQWQFSPAKKHGRPVSTQVELPIQLVDDNAG